MGYLLANLVQPADLQTVKFHNGLTAFQPYHLYIRTLYSPCKQNRFSFFEKERKTERQKESEDEKDERERGRNTERKRERQ